MRNSVAILMLLSGFLLAQPSFTAADIATNIGTASSVRAADMDVDGDMDILATSESGDKIYWFENDGNANPSFTARTAYANSDGAWAVIPYDIDRDGDLDIVSASHVDNKIRVNVNNGAADPDFDDTVYDVVSGVDARGLDLGDIDNDGDIDVVGALGSDNSVTWYENNGNRSFIARSINSDALSIFFSSGSRFWHFNQTRI